MKTIIIAMLLSLLSCQGTSQVHRMIDENQTLNSGDLETKEIQLENFDSVEVSSGIKVYITQGLENKAKVESNFLNNVSIEVDNKKLHISYDFPKDTFVKNAKTIVYLSATNLTKLEANSAGFIEVENSIRQKDLKIKISSAGQIHTNFKGENLDIDASSAGYFKGEINTRNLTIEMSSASEIEITGQSYITQIDASSNACLYATKFKSKSVNADVSSMAKVKINVVNQLKADANSFGKIKYTLSDQENINVKESSSSGGKIIKVASF